MTPRHWMKIAGSALLILMIGLVITRGLSARGRHIAMMFGQHAQPMHASDIAIPVDGLAFRLNNTPLGALQSLSVVRSGPADVSGLHFIVRLDKGIRADQFANCELSVDNPGKIDKDTRFTCIGKSDAGYEDLVQFGTIKFVSPGLPTQTHRFEVPASLRDALHHASSTAMTSSAAGDTSTNGDGHFQLTVNGQKVVEIDGSDAGGTVVIRDPKAGEKIVDINGNNAGGNIVIRDPATGKNILEIHGNNGGGTVKVNGVTPKVDGKPPAKP